MRAKRYLIIFTVTGLLAGCAGPAERTPSGPLFGGGRSGTLTTPPQAETAVKPIPPGTLMSAWAGTNVEKFLRREDHAAMERSVKQVVSAPIGKKIMWRNARSGNWGTVTAVRDGTSATTGTYCREFIHTVTVEGRTEEKRNTACKLRSGRWEVF
jgi:surface antigen